ncbi:choline TMA-lyase-activating enzyme [Vibrio sp. HN007]|uniref:choline TMA-lyase-activating enzyme n=1 Tax=Vibrio iocasae TaxID=3098914 RepID=UPI0035D50348
MVISEQNITPTGRIFNIQKYSLFDGYGIRTLVFFKGCNLRCDWCANPEGLEFRYQVMYSDSKCSDCGDCIDVCPTGVHALLPLPNGKKHIVDHARECTGCRECEKVCVGRAINVVGKDYSVDDLMKIIMQDYDFYITSNGGVTLGGGELSLQTDFAVELLNACKKQQIHTAIETQGTTSLKNFKKLAAYTDLFLFDIKEIDTQKHQKLLGINNNQVKKNLEYLIDIGANIIIRMAIIKGVNDSYESMGKTFNYVMSLAEKGNIEKIEILPYHAFGKPKYEKLGMIYPISDDTQYTENELNDFEQFIEGFNFNIRLIRH